MRVTNAYGTGQGQSLPGDPRDARIAMLEADNKALKEALVRSEAHLSNAASTATALATALRNASIEVYKAWDK